jgi:hypothetical protein
MTGVENATIATVTIAIRGTKPPNYERTLIQWSHSQLSQPKAKPTLAEGVAASSCMAAAR